jgi:hypothetical protein
VSAYCSLGSGEVRAAVGSSKESESMISSISLLVPFPNSVTAAVAESRDNWGWGSAFAASNIGLDGGV